MLKMAFQYHLAIDDIMGNKSLKLCKYNLNDNDWTIIADLIHVLKVSLCYLLISICAVLIIEQIYKDATYFFLKDSAFTITHVISTMDHINAVLRSLGETALTPSIKQALTFAHKHLDNYYLKTDLSNVYCIVMGMWCSLLASIISQSTHSSPSLTKTQILLQHGWSKNWVDTAEKIVRDKFIKYDQLDNVMIVVCAYS